MSRFRDSSPSVFSDFIGLDLLEDQAWIDQIIQGNYIIVSRILGAGLTKMVSPQDLVSMIRDRMTSLGYDIDIRINPIIGEQDFYVMKVPLSDK